ncbi:phenylalanine 4-monooxygenase [Psychrosphaera sp. 1_MG-2023]|uniref:phenylalanine 4-monooxygenase n=1 Tax=Psychrosphaera sp. 1_MG-2023 TaxID=3062643 RepID=UPI0026E47844|nr:phenylalanine 4-monooxygenase [Psychrosphaera sp. 1_MG-2023]MDO6720017.1 phenylalanine 4-monooxygenase [Psychrosphaera sp. 1_MG-2023]
MSKQSSYVSKQSDETGFINWTDEENQIWSELMARQMSCIEGKACDEFFAGLDKLQLPTDRVPQLNDVSKVLLETTGWQCAEVPALINFEKFFQLLADKKFPVATFIRRREHFDYLQEPDVFHEIFGHCAMLTNPDFSEFTHKYGLLGLQATKEERVFLARLYWFTVEFGLMRQHGELRIYGGGILSSPGETDYALTATQPERFDMNILDVFRTPYRIDIMQPKYFVIDAIHDLFDFSKLDLMEMVREAMKLGMYAPTFPPKSAA